MARGWVSVLGPGLGIESGSESSFKTWAKVRFQDQSQGRGCDFRREFGLGFRTRSRSCWVSRSELCFDTIWFGI